MSRPLTSNAQLRQFRDAGTASLTLLVTGLHTSTTEGCPLTNQTSKHAETYIPALSN